MTMLFIIAFMSLVGSTTCMAAHLPANPDAPNPHQTTKGGEHGGGHGGGHGGTPPEHFLLLDLLAESIHSSTGMLWVKVTELKPKFEHIQRLYLNGEKTKALATTLGVATEVILLGFFVETFGIAELFIGALSFSDDWIFHMALSLVGVNLSTKAAVMIAEGIEEAVEEKYQHGAHAKP